MVVQLQIIKAIVLVPEYPRMVILVAVGTGERKLL